MNDTEKLNWLLKEAGYTRTDLDNALETDKLLDDIVASMRGDRPARPSSKERFDWLLSYHNNTIGEKGLIPLSVAIVDAEILSDNYEDYAPQHTT